MVYMMRDKEILLVCNHNNKCERDWEVSDT